MLLGRWLNKRANEKSFEVHFWSVALTFAIINSTIDNSKSGGVVEYHPLSRWTKISVPSIYRKVLQLSDKGYLQSDIVKGDKFADKAIYSITDQGRAYFKELMASCAAGTVPLLFDFNVVITNLNKMDKAEALELVSTLRRSIQSSAESNEGYAREFADIPLVGRTIFEQQQLLYRALLEWLDHFEGQFLEE